MRKLSLIELILILFVGVLSAQNSVALLDAPIRPLRINELETKKQLAHEFAVDRGMIYLEANLEGQIGEYVLDTGAPGLIINEIPTTPHEGYTAQSCAEEVVVGVRPVNYFSLGSLELERFEAITLDLEHLSAAHEAKVYGLIGYELLKNYTLLLDYTDRQLHLLDFKVNRAIHQPVTSLPFILDGHLPVVEIKVGERTLRLGIDTGSASNILHESWGEELDQWGPALPSEEVQGLDQRVQKVHVAELQLVECGAITTDIKFLMMDLSHLRQGVDQPLDGLLGYHFLSQYKVAIDYPNKQLFLWPLESEY